MRPSKKKRHLCLFLSLTDWVYQPRPSKRKRFPLPVSAVFPSVSQSVITTKPAGICSIQSPAYSVVIPSIKNSIGHPVCEFSIVNDFKKSGFTYCNKSYVYSSVDVVKTISRSFLTPLVLSVLCSASSCHLCLLFPQLFKSFWLFHCPQITAIVFVALVPSLSVVLDICYSKLAFCQATAVSFSCSVSTSHTSYLTNSNCTSAQH